MFESLAGDPYEVIVRYRVLIVENPRLRAALFFSKACSSGHAFFLLVEQDRQRARPIESNKDVTNVYVTSIKQCFLIDRMLSFLPSLEASWLKGEESDPEKVFWSDPYKDQNSGNLIVTLFQAVTEPNFNKLLGVVAMDIKVEPLNGLVGNINVNYNGYASAMMEVKFRQYGCSFFHIYP